MHVLIIGGGVAGLAAAVACVDAGHRVTLCEARSFCGGRAYSFTDPKTGEIIDNGQHLLMGCYRATFDYLARIGSRALVTVAPQLRVDLLRPDGTATEFSCPRLPAPWHVILGLLRWRSFPTRDVWRLRRGLGAWDGVVSPRPARHDPLNISVAEWLDRCGQSLRARELFWEPLTVAVMNETMARAAAAPFLAMLREGLQTRGVPQGLAFPRAPLSHVFVDPAVAYVTARGAQIRTATTITQLDADPHHVRAVHTRAGEVLTADALIMALPPRELSRVMAASPWGAREPWTSLTAWESVPILSVHLWYDRPVLPASMVGLIGSPFHWAFDQQTLAGAKVGGRSSIALVSSACREMVAWSRDAIVQAAQQTIATYCRSAAGVTPRHTQVTKELHATVSLTPGIDGVRLSTRTGIRNLFLAGDWTQTYLPATIEGAVRSGYAAARAIGT